MATKTWCIIALALAVALCCTPLAAYAQPAIGGGGAGIFQTGETWVQQNVIGLIVFAGVVAIGGALMFMRAHPMWCLSAIAGAIVLGAAATIATSFGGAGG